MSAVTARTETRREVRLPLLGVSFLVVVAGLVGLVFGGRFRSEPAPPVKTEATTVAAAGVRLELPSGWARGAATALPGFDRPLWLDNTQTGTGAAVELLPAASPTLLPVALHATGAPATVQLAPDRQAWRYRVLSSDGSPVIVYAAPTTKGIATVGCVQVSGGAGEQACRAVAAALTVPGARRLAPGQHAAFFSQLPATVAALDAARAKGVRALGTATAPAGQAQAAGDLARAHHAAVAELGPLSSNGDSLASETVGALGATASAYTALANAARARTPQPYAAAATAVIGADARLRRAMASAATALNAASDRAATATVKPPVAKPASTPAATPASTPASTPAATPASTPAATPASTPAATPAHSRAAKPAHRPKSKPATGSTGKAVAAAGSQPVSLASSKKGGLDPTLPVLLLFGGLGGFLLAYGLERRARARTRKAA